MELNNQIRKYRKELNLSQDDFAEKLYVSRQTISNWETGKNYPDIHSLLMMSNLFGITLDQLIKGDLTIMEEKIKTKDVHILNRYGAVFSLLLFLFVISAVPLVYFFDYVGIGILFIFFLITLYFSFKVEAIKKQNDVQTYREIVAFCSGEKLDEIQKNREYGKRPYQKILFFIGSAVVCGAICAGMIFIMKTIL